MTAHTDIRAALEVGLTGVTGFPTASNRAWENVKFDPTEGTAWVRMTLVPGETRAAHLLGSTVTQRYNGLVRVDVFEPEGNGPNNADTLADNIRSTFEPGDTFTNGSVTVTIAYSERGGGSIDGPWYTVPVTISYYAYI